MQEIYNDRIKEKIFVEDLDNGLKVFIMPRNISKKYILWATNFGSIDNKFKNSDEGEFTVVPDGIAHYLEHKLFEQENGKNSLDVLTSLGVDANAYTTNDHTAFLYEATENFDEALDEFMDYVQKPYFTDANVEKERGIISQEIMMYDDVPEWKLYMNAMRAMYKENEINIDVAGTVETIKAINKEYLYKIYNTFYRPDNMVLVVAGGVEVNDILDKIKQRMIMKKPENTIIRKYNEEPKGIVKKQVIENRDISMPIVMMAYKDDDCKTNAMVKDVAIDFLGNIIFGEASELFKDLYENAILQSPPTIEYEFSKTFGHVLINFQTDYKEDAISKIENKIEEIKINGISDEEFLRTKKMIYGEMIKDYNDISTIASFLVADYFKGINSLDYFEVCEKMTKEDLINVLKELFVKDNEVISIIEGENIE